MNAAASTARVRVRSRDGTIPAKPAMVGALLIVAASLAGCAAAPKYTGSSPASSHPGASGTTGSNTQTRTQPQPRTPERLPAQSQVTGRVPDGPERWGDHYLRGMSSYYGPGFHGKKTANGEIFNMYKLTAAHRTLPLGTKARIWNVENGRSCIVIINDRGPFIEGRILDLSYAAGLELEMVVQGVAMVQIQILKLPEK
jgi:rare lipoprotein A (peptidoglycan hydrolase)